MRYQHCGSSVWANYRQPCPECSIFVLVTFGDMLLNDECPISLEVLANVHYYRKHFTAGRPLTRGPSFTRDNVFNERVAFCGSFKFFCASSHGECWLDEYHCFVFFSYCNNLATWKLDNVAWTIPIQPPPIFRVTLSSQKVDGWFSMVTFYAERDLQVEKFVARSARHTPPVATSPPPQRPPPPSASYLTVFLTVPALLTFLLHNNDLQFYSI